MWSSDAECHLVQAPCCHHLDGSCFFYTCLQFFLEKMLSLFSFSCVHLAAWEDLIAHLPPSQQGLMSQICQLKLSSSTPLPACMDLDASCFHLGVPGVSLVWSRSCPSHYKLFREATEGELQGVGGPVQGSTAQASSSIQSWFWDVIE